MKVDLNDRLRSLRKDYWQAKVLSDQYNATTSERRRELVEAAAAEAGIRFGETVLVLDNGRRVLVTGARGDYGWTGVDKAITIRLLAKRILKNGSTQTHEAEVWQGYKVEK
jgi:hypothetical protein